MLPQRDFCFWPSSSTATTKMNGHQNVNLAKNFSLFLLDYLKRKFCIYTRLAYVFNEGQRISSAMHSHLNFRLTLISFVTRTWLKTASEWTGISAEGYAQQQNRYLVNTYLHSLTVRYLNQPKVNNPAVLLTALISVFGTLPMAAHMFKIVCVPHTNLYDVLNWCHWIVIDLQIEFGHLRLTTWRNLFYSAGVFEGWQCRVNSACIGKYQLTVSYQISSSNRLFDCSLLNAIEKLDYSENCEKFFAS